MFSRKDTELTNLTHYRAMYCKFMICIMRGNLHIKILFTLFCMFAGIAIAYYQGKAANKEYRSQSKITIENPVEETAEKP